jgi:diamine N-acetyltransferase
MLQIRPLFPQDADILAPTAQKIFIDTFLPNNAEKDVLAYAQKFLTADVFRRELAEPTYFTFGCYLGEELVGYMQMLKNPNESHDGVDLELKRFYLLSAQHGRGYADEMMKVCEQKAQELGYKSFWLGVWELNLRAQKFYQKKGFKKVSSHQFVMGSETQTDFIFSKTL